MYPNNIDDKFIALFLLLSSITPLDLQRYRFNLLLLELSGKMENELVQNGQSTFSVPTAQAN